MARYSPNPFYVHPGGDLSRGLDGLGQVLAENRAANEEKARQEAQQQRIQMAQQAARQALQSGDPMMVADVAMEYPEVADMLNKQAGIIDDAKKQDATQFSMALLAAAPEDRAAVYQQRIKQLSDQGRDPSHTMQSYRDYLADPEREIRGVETMFAATNPDAYKSYREATTVKPAETREIKRGDRIVTEQWDGEKWVQIADAARFNPKAGTTVNVGTGGAVEEVVTPPELLRGLPPEVAEKHDAVYRAAGGGKDGLDALNKLSEKLSEQDRRAQSENILKASFPNASEDEMAELKAAMNAAENTEAGLQQAREVRESQRKTKKGKQFQQRAVSLLRKIVDNPNLPDVLGSLEGSVDFRLFDDEEAELIADIEEAGNILTAENLDLMSGVLSESDIALLKSLASGGLNRRRTEDRFISDVQSMIERLSSGGEAEESESQVGRFKVRVK
jgi:hypothetical protein